MPQSTNQSRVRYGPGCRSDDVRLRLASFFLECPGDDRKVAVADPKIDDLLPLVSQTGKCPEAVIGGRL